MCVFIFSKVISKQEDVDNVVISVARKLPAGMHIYDIISGTYMTHTHEH